MERTRSLSGVVREKVGSGLSEYLSTGRIDFLQSSDIERSVEELYATVKRSSNVTIYQDGEPLVDDVHGHIALEELEASIGDPEEAQAAVVLNYGSSVIPARCPYSTSIEEYGLEIEGVDHPLWADLDFEHDGE